MSVEKDVVYSAPDGREIKLDIYRPEGTTVPTRTAVILIHGGGWVFGNRGLLAHLCEEFTAEGFLAIAPEYRLARETAWPAQQDDVVTAIRWVAENAERLGIDADRIVIGGASAGGHLALMAAGALRKTQPVAAILSLFSASEVTVSSEPVKGMLNASRLIGADASNEIVQQTSPLYRVTEGFPPVFVLHGAADWYLDQVASLRLYERLVSVGVTAELHIVAAAHHEFIEEPGMIVPMVGEMSLFLKRILLEPKRWVAEAEASNLFARGPAALKAAIAAAEQKTVESAQA